MGRQFTLERLCVRRLYDPVQDFFNHNHDKILTERNFIEFTSAKAAQFAYFDQPTT